MPNATSLVASFLVNAIWQVTVIAGAGWLAARFIRRLGPGAEHVTFVITLMAAILTPVMLPLGRWLALLFIQTSDGSKLTITAMTAGNIRPDAHSVHVIPAMLLWPLLSLFFGSIVYFAIRFIRSLCFAQRLMREAGPIEMTEEQQDLWDRCRQLFACHAIRIGSSLQVEGPVALGVREPTLLFPDDFIVRCESNDLVAAFAHECAHVRRNDFAKNLAYEAASLIVAFHPAIWFIKSQIAQTREMVCDAMVTKKLNEPRSYAHSLLRLAELVAVPRVSAPLAIGIFDANILEKRIMTINERRLTTGAFRRACLITIGVVLLFGITAGSAAMAVAVEEQAPAQNAAPDGPYGPIYKIGKDVSAPALLHSVEAKFPESARNSKEPVNGITLIGLVVDSSGMPRDIHVTRSFKADFDEQAVKAVEQYRFKPAMRAGKPVAVSVTIEVNFKRY